MEAWSEEFDGSRPEILDAVNANGTVPDLIKRAIVDALGLFSEDAPVTVRHDQRPKDKARPIEVAHLADGSSKIIGNVEDVTVTMTGIYRVATSGHPDANVPVVISIAADMSRASKAES
jgi:hypothetical protein